MQIKIKKKGHNLIIEPQSIQYLDDLGWVGFDVSNGISPDERYVRLATGLDSREAAPISGLRMGSSSESMIVSLQIQQ